MNLIDFDQEELEREYNREFKDEEAVYSQASEKVNATEEIETVSADNATKGENSDKKKGIIREVISMVINLLICFVLVFFITTFVGQRTVVSGMSMYDTLSDGDNLIVDKISYRFHDPERFDVIVFPYQYAENTYYIKRIIGLPGETVYIAANGNIYINDQLLQESYGTETILDPGLASTEITLGEDEYFVMGDNRNNSSDSRFEAVGNVKGEDIIGKAWVRIYPFDSIGFIDNLE